MEMTGRTQVSMTAPDCRAMATTSRQPRVVGYNVHSVVETKHHLIVALEVTNHGYDRDALTALAAKEAMPGEIGAIADTVYYKGEEIIACEAGICVAVSKPQTSDTAAAGRFDRADFVYHSEQDAYVCPAGRKLTYLYTNEEAGKVLRNYWTNACQDCVVKHRQADAEVKACRLRRIFLPAVPAQDRPRRCVRYGGGIGAKVLRQERKARFQAE
jgi:hypothetical protein